MSIDIVGSVLEDNVSGTKWRGLAFPLVRRKDGFFSSKTTRDLVFSSIYSILITPYGSRIMRPDFGSALKELVFEPNDDILEAEAKIYLKEAIEKWEPRVTNVKVVVSREGRQLRMALSYTIIETGESIENYLEFEKEKYESARLVV